MVPGRLGMLLTLFLMLVNMSSSVSQTIPKSDTVCPLVAWILLSIVFVFSALLEYFAILLKMKFKGFIRVFADDKTGNKLELWIKKLDMVSLLLFPTFYLLAVVIFVSVN